MEIRAEPIWCAVANVKAEILYGENLEPRNGTKHFKGGAKIYVIDAYWGMVENVVVIGRHRKSFRYICLNMDARHLENFRLALVYSPKVIELVGRHYQKSGYVGTSMFTKENAERICQDVPNWENY